MVSQLASHYDIGFRVNCLIQYNEPEIIQDEFGVKIIILQLKCFQREKSIKWFIEFLS